MFSDLRDFNDFAAGRTSLDRYSDPGLLDVLANDEYRSDCSSVSYIYRERPLNDVPWMIMLSSIRRMYRKIPEDTHVIITTIFFIVPFFSYLLAGGSILDYQLWLYSGVFGAFGYFSIITIIWLLHVLTFLILFAVFSEIIKHSDQYLSVF